VREVDKCRRCGWRLPTNAQLAESVRDAQDRARVLDAQGYGEHARELRQEALRRTAARLESQLCDVCACPMCPKPQH
jgi:epoxyqueuosine reductase QueG